MINVEAFIKPNSFPVDAIDGYQVDAMLAKDVRALVAQLVPAGHVVVPRDELSMILRSHKCEHEVEMLAHRHLMNICGLTKTMKWRSEPEAPLPASSGPEQTKCACNVSRAVCSFFTKYDEDVEGCETCRHSRACHTPAPAAKEVMPRSE